MTYVLRYKRKKSTRNLHKDVKYVTIISLISIWFAVKTSTSDVDTWRFNVISDPFSGSVASQSERSSNRAVNRLRIMYCLFFHFLTSCRLSNLCLSLPFGEEETPLLHLFISSDSLLCAPVHTQTNLLFASLKCASSFYSRPPPGHKSSCGSPDVRCCRPGVFVVARSRPPKGRARQSAARLVTLDGNEVALSIRATAFHNYTPIREEEDGVLNIQRALCGASVPRGQKRVMKVKKMKEMEVKKEMTVMKVMNDLKWTSFI